jgi:hypothetical protein
LEIVLQLAERSSGSRASEMHIVEMFVQRERLYEDIQGFRGKIVQVAVRVLEIDCLETRNRALRVITLMCLYF